MFSKLSAISKGLLVLAVLASTSVSFGYGHLRAPFSKLAQTLGANDIQAATNAAKQLKKSAEGELDAQCDAVLAQLKKNDIEAARMKFNDLAKFVQNRSPRGTHSRAVSKAKVEYGKTAKSQNPK